MDDKNYLLKPLLISRSKTSKLEVRAVGKWIGFPAYVFFLKNNQGYRCNGNGHVLSLLSTMNLMEF